MSGAVRNPEVVRSVLRAGWPVLDEHFKHGSVFVEFVDESFHAERDGSVEVEETRRMFGRFACLRASGDFLLRSYEWAHDFGVQLSRGRLGSWLAGHGRSSSTESAQ